MSVELSNSNAMVLDDDQLQSIYVWVDSVPLSRPKRNIARDFSDGVLAAEILTHYFPKLVDLHNYSAANSIRQKLYNWATLNQKVLKRIGFEISKPDIEGIVNCKPGVIEVVLFQLQRKIAEYRSRKHAGEALTPAAGGSPAGIAAPGSEPTSARMAAVVAPTHVHAMGAASAPTPMVVAAPGASVDAVVLAEKDATIAELRETIEILELKIKKLEQLVRLKDSRIATLDARLRGVAPTSGTAAAPPGMGVIPAGAH